MIPTWQTILDKENGSGTAVEEAPSSEPSFGDTASTEYETSLPSVESSIAQVRCLRRHIEAKERYRAVAYAAILFAVVGWALVLFCP